MKRENVVGRANVEDTPELEAFTPEQTWQALERRRGDDVVPTLPEDTAVADRRNVVYSGTVVTGLPVSWASSDPAVAAMTGLGTATGMSPGVTTITAIVDGRSGSTQLSVRSPEPQISEVSPDRNASRNFSWSTCSGCTVVTISVSGLSSPASWRRANARSE